jgi:hypothetical protein
LHKLAPIVLFVYNRPEHTQKTIQALQQNTLASDSELFIYADAAKNDSAQMKVIEVRKIISNVSGFKKITLIEQDNNKGLANSIIDGVTEIVNKYGSVIVLEDDLVTSPFFLSFMNQALDYHKNNKDVWHVSGWSYPIKTDELGDTFLWRTMNCWGWATWGDRWKHFDKNTDQLMSQFGKGDIKRFNLDGSQNFWQQILANKEGKINTWAIYWYATIFSNKGLCLNPSQTFIENIGLDGSGVHCGIDESYESKLTNTDEINFNLDFCENELAVSRIKFFLCNSKKSLLKRVYAKVMRIFS